VFVSDICKMVVVGGWKKSDICEMVVACCCIFLHAKKRKTKRATDLVGGFEVVCDDRRGLVVQEELLGHLRLQLHFQHVKRMGQYIRCAKKQMPKVMILKKHCTKTLTAQRKKKKRDKCKKQKSLRVRQFWHVAELLKIMISSPSLHYSSESCKTS